MAEDGTRFGWCVPLAGQDLVARHGSLAVVTEDTGPGADAILGALEVVGAASGDGTMLVLAAARAALEHPGHSASVAGITRDGELAVYVQGNGAAVVQTDAGQATEVTAAGSMLPVSRTFSAATVTVYLAARGNPARWNDPRLLDHRLRLDGGVVRGGALMLTAVLAAFTPAVTPAATPPAGAPAVTGTTEVVPVTGISTLAAHEELAAPEEIDVWFRAPGQEPSYGQPPQTGPRPPLGVLVLDDGTEFPLDRDYIVGREPSVDGDVSRSATVLRVTDPDGTVSRTHLRISVASGRVEVQDLGSANGSLLRLPDGDRQLAPHDSAVIGPDTSIGIGNRSLRYLPLPPHPSGIPWEEDPTYPAGSRGDDPPWRGQSPGTSR
jgi:hypothetical protein